MNNSEDPPKSLIEYEMCGSCAGSGEGHWDGSVCNECRGSGEARIFEEEDNNEPEGPDCWMVDPGDGNRTKVGG